MLNATRLRLLRDILRQSTAPFREQLVARCVAGHLHRAKVPFFEDPTGNLVLGVDSPAAYRRLLRKRDDNPVRVFIAHMDHPGFHGVRWLDARRLEVKWLGGSPVKYLSGAPVWVADETGELARGRLARVSIVKQGWAIDRAEVYFTADADVPLQRKANTLFGGFRFRASHWTSGKRLYTRAADDLAGVFCIVSTAIDLFCRRGNDAPFIGLLTRGEEVGFVGAVKHFELGWLTQATRPVVCVSLEASRTLPGALIGKGPVVRLGDKRTIFDSGGLRVLSELADKVLPRRHQRRVMDGGACEATVAIAWGLPTIGITLPLGNYHNQGFDGGMDCRKLAGPAPEFVHLDDIEGELKLCRALMRPGLHWDDPWGITRLSLSKNACAHRKHF